GIITTFGAAARYDDEPWDAHYVGCNGVRTVYSDLLRALPDLQIDVQRRHVSEATVVLVSSIPIRYIFLNLKGAELSRIYSYIPVKWSRLFPVCARRPADICAILSGMAGTSRAMAAAKMGPPK
ncbi:MAG TPA: hypothetical protein VFN84_07965, partial [Pseudolabrys sp.]|nr:hypothetical protein [Pseudolabrys sp.]